MCELAGSLAVICGAATGLFFLAATGLGVLYLFGRHSWLAILLIFIGLAPLFLGGVLAGLGADLGEFNSIRRSDYTLLAILWGCTFGLGYLVRC
jgi:hypothetical protein